MADQLFELFRALLLHDPRLALTVDVSRLQVAPDATYRLAARS